MLASKGLVEHTIEENNLLLVGDISCFINSPSLHIVTSIHDVLSLKGWKVPSWQATQLAPGPAFPVWKNPGWQGRHISSGPWYSYPGLHYNIDTLQLDDTHIISNVYFSQATYPTLVNTRRNNSILRRMTNSADAVLGWARWGCWSLI